ncbi:hypothetical protein LTR70_002838 [Exophiala xenobiotica]|uniref:DUF3835 domain-containing protein n=1 Tax=Lithohypha guttulata TaxID=1690604 RepID=A0ABR0KJC7_9EURO|nr:hypothetical protein LTR24_002052 [Lithohypha guttulata]KAK5324554.1 hypothetical protein LTR70_002838 [Exophiala xenobiotica]
MDNDLIERVAKQCLELEANIAKLRNVLKHWQTLELDYEGLKDEFQGLDEETSQQDCLQAAQDFEPHKVDAKELTELIEPSKGKVRRPSQIVEVLSKRGEYVSKNITSLRDQITRLEKERNALLLATQSEPEDEAGLPVAEITEELDEDGNVLSSTVQPQGDSASKVLDVLEKAEVAQKNGEVDDDSIVDRAQSTAPKPGMKEKVLVDDEDDSDDESISSEIVSEGASKARAHGPSNPEDTEEEARLRQEMLQYGLGEVGSIVAELDMIDDEDKDLNDDGLNMEDVSDFDDDEYDDSLDEDESEDEDGRVRRPLHSEKYRKQMEDLQKQLGFEMQNVGPTPDLLAEVQAQIEHLPPSEVEKYIESLPPTLRKQINRPPAKEAARKAAIAREDAARSSLKDTTAASTSKPKKGSEKKVAFAPDLDIAPGPASPPTQPTTTETVVERSSSIPTSQPSAPVPPPQPPKTSRFKAARSSQPQTPLFPPAMDLPDPQSSSSPSTHQPTFSGPPNKTLSDVVIERPPPFTTSTSTSPFPPPPPPDDSTGDFDTDLQKRQIALEHHRLHNKLIHAQGGYVRGGELENWGDEYASPEFEDPTTGEVRKVSRFKAARMR